MPSLSDAIGTFFENRVLRALPGIEDYRDVDCAPDFKWGEVWLEAKTGFKASDYGAVPKRYQIAYHEQFDPLIYLCGYHDFERATKRLTQKTHGGKIRHLERNAAIAKAFFVSADVVKRIWDCDARTNDKGTIEYCTISASNLSSIVHNRPITRAGGSHHAREYYGVQDVVCLDADPIGYIFTPQHTMLVSKLQEIDQYALLRGQANGRTHADH